MTSTQVLPAAEDHLPRSAGGADGVDVRADSPDWAEVQAVLSRGDRRMTDVLLAIPSGELSVRTFFETMAALGLEKEHYVGVEIGDPRRGIVVQSGVSENYFHYELKLAA
ncbi:MAG: hypothetical protein R3A10_00140 [Caldilineaceae bacterium]